MRGLVAATYLALAVFAFSDTANDANVVQRAWLNAIVGTQSLVMLGTPVIASFASASSVPYFLIYGLWMVVLAPFTTRATSSGVGLNCLW